MAASENIPQTLQAVLMGIVEGITEFLPISSTGHLILFSDMIGFKDTSGHAFEVVIQLGAILAICWLYFSKLFEVLQGIFKRDKASWRFAVSILLAFLPSAILGVLLHDFIKNVLFSPFIVAIALIVGGIAILAVEYSKPVAKVENVDDLSPVLSLKIGIIQCLSLIPGVSRSGATIIGALLMGVGRKAAAEFSFFLAIPTMMGAAAYDLYKNVDKLSGDDLSLILIGFVTSFIVALLVVRWFIGFIAKHGFSLFAWYRIGLGVIVLLFYRRGMGA